MFLGQPTDASTLLIRYTYSGDANIDGTVDLTDFTYLAANFNGSGETWLKGDFNYDGVVDLTDFTFLASNFNQNLPAGSSAASLGRNVPEPAVLPMLPVIVAALCRRRRAPVP